MDLKALKSSMLYDENSYSYQEKLDAKDTLECFIDSFKALMHYNPIMMEIFNDPIMLISSFPELKPLICGENFIPGEMNNYRVKRFRKGYQININGKFPIKYYHKNIQTLEGYVACKALKLKVQQDGEQLFIWSTKLFEAFDILSQDMWMYHKVSFIRSYITNKELNDTSCSTNIKPSMNLVIIRNLVKSHDVYLLRE